MFTLMNTDKYGSQSGEFKVGNMEKMPEPSGLVYAAEEDLTENIVEGEEYPICGYYFGEDELSGVAPSEYFAHPKDNPSKGEYSIIITVKFLKDNSH